MAKRKTKFVSEGVAPPQPRSLRSRNRESPGNNIFLTVNGKATLQKQVAEGSNTAVVEVPLQECASISNQLQQATEHSCFTKYDESTEEKHAETIVKVSEEQEEKSGTYLNNDSLLHGCKICPKNYTNKMEINLGISGNKEINLQEVTKLVSDTCTDQHQVLTFEDGDGPCDTDLEKHLGAKRNLHCNLERGHESSQEELNHLGTDDFREITNESAMGLPVRKKRRMGMCGLTEKERINFLQTQKLENGLNRVERVDKQPCKNAADHVAQQDNMSPLPLVPSSPSMPIDVTVQGKTYLKLQSCHCGEETRAESEVTIIDGISALYYPACSDEKTSETEVSTVPESEQTDVPKSNQPAEEKMEGHIVNLNPHEYEESTSEIPVKLREDDDSAVGLACISVSTHTSSSQNEQTEKKNCGSEADSLQVCVTLTRDEIIDDTGVRAAFTDPMSGGFSSCSVELCEIAVTPSKGTDNCALAAHSSTMKTEDIQTGDTTEPFGSHYFDYVSDSQLNSIALNEERMEREEAPGFLNCPKDATNLIVGLIRELSSLNRMVMVTHRELESLRRGSKTSRSSIC